MEPEQPPTFYQKRNSFNPSCGLIGCGTAQRRGWHDSADEEFQSLVRVDWLWNSSPTPPLLVNLPRFNPSCGLIGCGTMFLAGYSALICLFQSLVRVDWLWNPELKRFAYVTVGFQSLVRVDWLWN